MLLSDGTILGLGIILVLLSLLLATAGYAAGAAAKRYQQGSEGHARHMSLSSYLKPVAVVMLIPALFCFWKILGLPF